MISVACLKGDGNDGEPDARRKLEFEKKAKIWLELINYGRFGMIFENIQSDLPKEVKAKVDLGGLFKNMSNYILVDGLG